MSETIGKNVEPEGTNENSLGSCDRPLERSSGCSDTGDSCDSNKSDEENRQCCGDREPCDG